MLIGLRVVIQRIISGGAGSSCIESMIQLAYCRYLASSVYIEAECDQLMLVNQGGQLKML